jgi:hypothetical protein
MAVRVVLTNKSQPEEGLSKFKTQPSIDETILMSREVYQYLRSRAKGKTLSLSNVPTELALLFDEFTKIQRGLPVSAEIRKLDEYLGTLGLTEEYYYVKDIIDIDQWLDVKAQDPIRNVASDGLNVIYTDKLGITYNVVHSTGE